MKKIHIYKAYSRLGLINVPHKQKSPNLGVEEGPNGVLANFNFDSSSQVDAFEFSTPEKIDKNKYLEIIAEESKKFVQLITQTIQPNDIQLVLGGDHSVSFPSLIALFERIDPKNIGHIQFDSHTDLHLVSTSPSGNFHGMWLRPLVDGFDNNDISRLVQKQLPPKNLLYIGNLDSEPEEIRFMKEHTIKTLSKDEVNIQKVASFTSQFTHIHINFDIDVFDPSISPATGTPPLRGFFEKDIFPILSLLSKHPSISIDLVEVNPQKPESQKTINLARQVLDTLLS
jgi:arginase